MKQWLDSKEIIYYKRYVDDILIVYDQSKRNAQIILHQINNVDKNPQFKLSTEENNIINYLDTSIHRNNTSLDIGVYTECPRRNVQYIGRVFLMLNYTDITQNTYNQVERLRR